MHQIAHCVRPTVVAIVALALVVALLVNADTLPTQGAAQGAFRQVCGNRRTR